ncbi:MAG: trigger factor [Clostridiales bacterium]|jgi:trigger factor|nr:trigger factor [Clostridiales bacterium]
MPNDAKELERENRTETVELNESSVDEKDLNGEDISLAPGEVRVENIEENKVRFIFGADKDLFERGMKAAYDIIKTKFNSPGFRKGKVPRKIIELNYGKEVFYDEAIDFAFHETYPNLVNDRGLIPVSQPEVAVLSVSTEAGVVFRADVYVKPVAEVSNYTGATYEEIGADVSEEEIDAKINEARDQNARLISGGDKIIEKGDVATIDYEGFIDGEPFEGGEGHDFDLAIGSGRFIAGFEEQLTGYKAGENPEITVRFPDDYHEESVRGREAVFKVFIREVKIKELPDIDDDFAADVSEFDTLKEYRDDIRQKLEQIKRRQADEKKEIDTLDHLIANTSVTIPEPMIADESKALAQNLLRNLYRSGFDGSQFIDENGEIASYVVDAQRETAEKRIKARLALEAVARAENISVSDEEIKDEASKFKEKVNSDEDVLSDLSEREKQNVKSDIAVRKALEFLKSVAKPREAEKNIEN